MHYPQTIILPPKIYFYEPKIFGFKIAGKRGSKYYDPPTGNVKIIESSMQSLDMEKIKKQLENIKLEPSRQPGRDEKPQQEHEN